MTRVKEQLNLVYHGIKTLERAEMFADVRSWLAEMDDSQPAEDERVRGIRERFTEGQEEVAHIRERADTEYRHEPGEQYTPMLKDIRTLLGELNLISELWQNAEKEIDELGSLLPVQPAQTVDLSLLPYEIAEELPKIGGEFGKLAAMCKSHVAAFIEKLISARTVQPVQIDPVNTYPTVVESVRLLEEAGFGAVGKPNTLLAMVKEAVAAVQPTASTSTDGWVHCGVNPNDSSEVRILFETAEHANQFVNTFAAASTEAQNDG